MNEKTLPTMMTRPVRLNQLRKTDVRRAGAGVVGVSSINHYLLCAVQLQNSLFIEGIIGCAMSYCLSDFGERYTFVGVT
jgi:hypothetical protein